MLFPCTNKWNAQVTETYALDGTPAAHKRRDLRRGRHTGSVSVADNGCLELRLQWADPFGGVEVDRFAVQPTTDRLVVETSMVMDGGRVVRYKTVYVRKAPRGG